MKKRHNLLFYAFLLTKFYGRSKIDHVRAYIHCAHRYKQRTHGNFMDDKEKTALRSVVVTILVIALIALAIAGVFVCAGHEKSAYRLIVKVLATAAPWLIIFIGALLLYHLGTHRASRREELELDSLPFLLTPAIGAWLIPMPFLLFCAVVWSVSLMFLGDKTLLQLFTHIGTTQLVMLIVACISGVCSILFLVYLFSFRIAYSTYAVRVRRFLRRECVLQWRDMTQIVLQGNQYDPLIGITFCTHTSHVYVTCAFFNSGQWDAFSIKMCEIARMYSVPVRRGNGNDYHK